MNLTARRSIAYGITVRLRVTTFGVRFLDSASIFLHPIERNVSLKQEPIYKIALMPPLPKGRGTIADGGGILVWNPQNLSATHL